MRQSPGVVHPKIADLLHRALGQHQQDQRHHADGHATAPSHRTGRAGMQPRHRHCGQHGQHGRHDGMILGVGVGLGGQSDENIADGGGRQCPNPRPAAAAQQAAHPRQQEHWPGQRIGEMRQVVGHSEEQAQRQRLRRQGLRQLKIRRVGHEVTHPTHKGQRRARKGWTGNRQGSPPRQQTSHPYSYHRQGPTTTAPEQDPIGDRQRRHHRRSVVLGRKTRHQRHGRRYQPRRPIARHSQQCQTNRTDRAERRRTFTHGIVTGHHLDRTQRDHPGRHHAGGSTRHQAPHRIGQPNRQCRQRRIQQARQPEQQHAVGTHLDDW